MFSLRKSNPYAQFLDCLKSRTLRICAFSVCLALSSCNRALDRADLVFINGFLEGLGASGLTWTAPQGAYFVMVDISPLGFANDVEATEWITREIGVAGVPGSSFFREPETRYVRFHFAKEEATLRLAGERLSLLKKNGYVR